MTKTMNVREYIEFAECRQTGFGKCLFVYVCECVCFCVHVVHMCFYFCFVVFVCVVYVHTGCVYVTEPYSNITGGKNLKKFKEWLEPDSITDTKILEQTWDLLAYLAYDTLQQVSRCSGSWCGEV